MWFLENKNVAKLCAVLARLMVIYSRCSTDKAEKKTTGYSKDENNNRSKSLLMEIKRFLDNTI